MIREPESKSFLARAGFEKETQPIGWVFLLAGKSKLIHSNSPRPTFQGYDRGLEG